MYRLIWVHPAYGDRAAGLSRLAGQLTGNHLEGQAAVRGFSLRLKPATDDPAGDAVCHLSVDLGHRLLQGEARRGSPSHAILAMARHAISRLQGRADDRRIAA